MGVLTARRAVHCFGEHVVCPGLNSLFAFSMATIKYRRILGGATAYG